MLFDDKLSDIIRTLENDGVLLHPTDTVWSLSCSIHSKMAIDKIYKIIKREENIDLTLLVDSLEMLKKYVPHIHPRIETLLHFHQKPLTTIYPNVKNIPSHVKRNDKNMAIRIIADPYCNKIIQLLGNPLATVSAQTAHQNQPYPGKFSDISEDILKEVDFISKHKRRDDNANLPSVLIEYDREGEINFLRL